MKIISVNPAKGQSAIGELYFGAPIDYQYLATTPDTEHVDVCMVNFSPGGRNKMHTHVYDQILYVTGGRGIEAVVRLSSFNKAGAPGVTAGVGWAGAAAGAHARSRLWLAGLARI